MTLSRNNISYENYADPHNFENNPLIEQCPECQSTVITDKFHGETVCNSCGLIMSEKAIDHQFEKNIFLKSEQETSARTGSPITVFTTDISEHAFINIKRIMDPNFKRVIKWGFRDRPNRSLKSGSIELKRIGSNLHLPECIQEIAMFLFKKAFKNELLKGRSIIGMVAGCLYYACRKARLPIGFHEIVKQTPSDPKTIQQYYRMLFKHFKLKVPPLGPDAFLSKYITKLGLGFEFERKARILLHYLPGNFINGKNPRVICASIIYLLGKENNLTITQGRISNLVGITETSIRKHLKMIKTFLENSDVRKISAKFDK